MTKVTLFGDMWPACAPGWEALSRAWGRVLGSPWGLPGTRDSTGHGLAGCGTVSGCAWARLRDRERLRGWGGSRLTVGLTHSRCMSSG